MPAAMAACGTDTASAASGAVHLDWIVDAAAIVVGASAAAEEADAVVGVVPAVAIVAAVADSTVVPVVSELLCGPFGIDD
jgi:hypothetical protein